MYWKFDANKFALHQLPPCLRRKGIYALVKCLMAGISYVHSLFSSHRSSVMQQLNHNGSVMSLERFLNEKFCLSGYIYIKDFLSANTYLHYEGETPEEVHVGYQDEGDIFHLSSNRPDDVSGGFTIMIPESMATDDNLAMIRKWTDYYRVAGTIYKIETYE